MSQELFAQASRDAAALQRVLLSVKTQPHEALQSADFQLLPAPFQKMVVSSLQQKALPPLHGLSPSGNGWWPLIRESYTGAWQRNEEVTGANALSYYAVYSCVRLISTDIGKMTFRLVEQSDDGIWTETTSPSFSPVLRQPNHYQTINQYVEQYILSKLLNGNTYVWKKYDNRGVVRALYVLDPTRVTPLVSQDGSVYYQLKRDDLSGLTQESIIVRADEIIHDTYIAPFHPLMGLSPLYACALPVLQGLSIQNSSNSFFNNGQNLGGVLTAPGAISDETAQRLLTTMKAKLPGEWLIAGDGLEANKWGMTAVDSQLIEQLRLTAEQVCGAYGVPPYLVDIGPAPPYTWESLILKYHSQCIQSLATNFEKAHDKGLGLVEKVEGRQLGTEFDIDDLIWMDTATRVESALKSIGSGGMSPDEARKRYFGLAKVAGGKTPYMQNQMWPLKQLAERETPAAPALPELPVVTDEPVEEDDTLEEAASLGSLLLKGLYAST